MIKIKALFSVLRSGWRTSYLKCLFFFLTCMLLTANAHAQADTQTVYLFFASPVTELVWYGRAPPSMGYGIALGSEDVVSIGLKCIYVMPLTKPDITTFELTILFRVYLSGADTVSGLFAQLTYGAVVFSGSSALSLPEESGAFSIGLTAGWRFPLGGRFFVEPYIRAGYPYYGGGGVAAGVKF